MWRGFGLGVVGVASACASPAAATDTCSGLVYTPTVRHVQMAELPELRASGTYDGWNRILTINLQFGPSNYPLLAPLKTSSGENYCPVLASDMSATLAGVPIDLTIANPGGWGCAGPNQRTFCFAPQAKITVPQDVQPPSAGLVIGDGSSSISIALDDMLLTRTAVPTNSPSWSFGVGTQATFQWAPGADVAAADSITVDFDLVTTPQGFVVHQVTTSGDSFAFPIPSGAIGDGRLVIQLQRTYQAVVATASVVHSATITP